MTCAVSVTCELTEKLALHVLPQLMPAGLLVTVPLELLEPTLVTVSVTDGDVVVNVSAFERLPPGLTTVTGAVPAPAMSVAGIAAVSWLALTNVVVRVVPFHRTVAPLTKFAPVTVKVNAGPPAGAELGASAAQRRARAWS